jgi:hypothetical protein
VLLLSLRDCEKSVLPSQRDPGWKSQGVTSLHVRHWKGRESHRKAPGDDTDGLVLSIFIAPESFFSFTEGALAQRMRDTNDLATNWFRGIPLILFCFSEGMLTVLCVFGCVLTGLFVEEPGLGLLPVSGSERVYTENRALISTSYVCSTVLPSVLPERVPTRTFRNAVHLFTRAFFCVSRALLTAKCARRSWSLATLRLHKGRNLR